MLRGASQPMYETDTLRVAAGDTMHPGGRQLTQRLLDLCELPRDARILDLGCGSGAAVAALTEAGFAHSMGFERHEPLVQSGMLQHPNLPLACALGGVLPIADNQVDLVLGECSLTAMGSFDQTLSEIQRVLRHGGRLAVSDIYVRRPEGRPALQALPLSCGLAEAQPQAELVASFQRHGFEILVWEDHSETLKHLAGELILAHGSLSGFWNQSEPAADPLDIQIAIGKARLGYFLLIAQKMPAQQSGEMGVFVGFAPAD